MSRKGAVVLLITFLYPFQFRAAGKDVSAGTETIAFQSGGFKIAGELRLPQGRGPHPLVIMVHGDGPGLRSYFAPLKETMLRAGFATLMWDKPGHGQSTGTLDQKKMMAERAAILLDAVTAMKRRPDIDPARIGLWGISQAGYVMPLALQKGADVNFMIAVGCPGENGIEQTAYLIRRQLMSAGMPEDEARRMEGHFRGIYMAQTFREYLVHARSLYDNPLQRKLGFVSALWTENDWKPHTQDEEAFIDPTGILETTTIPILAFFGENDTQVDPVQGAEAYRRSLVKAGNNHFRVEIIPGVDHNLIPSETGSMEEQARRSRAEWQRYAPAYLNIMEQWLKELSGERRLMTTNLKYRDILGCWEGQPEGRFSALNRGLWLISLRPDGRPAISLINDLTPRCQTREYDIEVRLDEDGSVSWEAHRGRLSEDRKAMTVVKDWKGERTTWTFTRREESDEEMARLAASIGNAYAYEIPESLPDGWECGDLEKAGIDPEILFPLLQRITRGNFADIHSLLIVKDGKLVLEEYFATNGRRFGPFVKRLFRSRPHHLASTTKAVLSALCGIAIDQGLLKNVDEPIAGILPAYARSFAGKKTAITVEHLLTMTPGWDWEQFRYPWADPRNNAAAMVDSQDVISYVLERPLGAEPGSKFNYSNGAPVVLGEILKNACGRDLDRFAECVLFGPLGIAAHPWTRYSDGTLETDGGLALPSRDLAKIGQLFLDKGEWSGRRLLSEAWIRKSTRPRLSLGGSRDWKYGYYWMQVELKEKDRTINSFFVPGDGGQLLAVFPDMEMVIVLTAGNYGPDPKTVGFLMIGNGILPAVRAQALSRTDASSSRTNFLPRGSS